MVNPQIPGHVFLLAIAKERQSNLLHEVEHDRLIKKAKSQRSNLLDCRFGRHRRSPDLHLHKSAEAKILLEQLSDRK